MPTFKNPVYVKKQNAKTGAMEPCYVFPIIFGEDEDTIQIILDTNRQINLQDLQACVLENVEWWNTLVAQFLAASSKHFAKPYTVDSINKIVKHSITSQESPTDSDCSVAAFFTPKEIQIYGGNFMVNWHCNIKNVIINVSDLTMDDVNDEHLKENDNIETVKNMEVTDSSLPVLDGIQELSIEDIPGDSNEVMNLGDPSRYYERQRVREARLKAKLALYKAQLETSKYYEKYGVELSDSDESSEYDTSDEETEEEEEEGV